MKDFFDTVQSAAKIGNWSDSDKIRITVLKLTDVAKASYCSSVELQSADVTWEAFKTRFMHRFKTLGLPSFIMCSCSQLGNVVKFKFWRLFSPISHSCVALPVLGCLLLSWSF